MKNIILTILLTFTLNAQLVDAVALIVKGSAITLYDIKKEIKNSKVKESQAIDILVRKKLEELEIKERNIKVASGEVYDDIKKTADRNNMSINDFYEAVRDANGMNSTELKAQIKQKLLSQKLYSAIAYSSVSQPDEDDITEYYELHKNDFAHPSSFDVVIYATKSKSRLQEKIDNPMFYSPDIQTNEQKLPYDRISPELAGLLEKTAPNTFTSVVPDGKGGYMSFYVKSIESAKESGIDSVRSQIVNLIMGSKREQVLGEYFTRLKLNADIQTIRTLEADDAK